MPRIIIIENKYAPGVRTRLQADALLRKGWEVVVLLRKSADLSPVNDLPGCRILRVSPDIGHPLIELRRRQLKESDAGMPRNRTAKAAFSFPSPFGQSYTLGTDLLRLESYWLEVAAEAAAHSCDVIEACDLHTLPAAVWSADAAEDGRKIVFEARELHAEANYIPEIYREGWRELARTFVPRADLTISVSEEAAAIFRRRYGAANTAIVHCYPLLTGYSKRHVREWIGLDEHTPLGVHVGSIPENRHVDQLIPLLDGLQALHVALVGVDPESEQFRNLLSVAVSAGVDGRLHAISPRPPEELVSFLRSADFGLLINPPDVDYIKLTLPNKLFDCLSAGLPMVVTEGAASAARVSSLGAGVTFPVDEEGSLARAVGAVLSDETYRLAADRLRNTFDWARECEHYVEALETLLS